MAELNAAAVDKAYQAALAKYEPQADAKAGEKMQKFGLTAPAISIPIGGSVCESWPSIRDFLNGALGFMFWAPGMVAKAKALLSMIDTVVMPLICGPKK